MRLRPLLALIPMLSLALGQGAPVILSSEVFGKTVDTHSLGQTFTTTKPVTLNGVDVYAKRVQGGMTFSVTVCSYDPWSKVRGDEIGTAMVPAGSIAPEGGWVAATFGTPVVLLTPGIYAIFISAEPGGNASGYNEFGLAWGDSIVGGRFLGPTSSSTTELLFRLRGSAASESFLAVEPAVPRISITTQPFYSSALKAWRTEFSFKWTMQEGAAYVVYSSTNLVNWTYSSKRLGRIADATFTTMNEYHSARYFRFEAMPLGDLSY